MSLRHLLILGFTACPLILSGQEPPATDTDPATLSTIRQTVQTIDAVDRQYAQQEAEVLADTPPTGALPTDTPATGIQDHRPAPPVLPDAPAVPADQVFLELPGAQAAESVVTRDIDTISIDFPDEDVRTIIRNVAELYELNVVIPDTLVGSISIKLRNVTWRQVFNVILEPLNFTFIEDANIIKIRSRDELAAEPVDTRVFIINFAKAEEISKSIGPLIDTTIGGRIQVDTRSNALVITERPSRMGGIQEIIDVLDRPTEQVMIESKFVEVTGRDERSLGLDWASLAEFSVGAGPFGRSYSDTQGRTRDIGIDTSDNLSITTTDSGRTSQFSTSDLATSNTLWTGDLVRTDTAVFSMDAFNLVLSALERNNEVQLISNPTVVTVNNTPATINIGEEFPIPNYTYNPERGTFEVAGFEYKPIGINLNVTPQINSAGFINLIIKPEISSRTGEVTFGGAAGAVIPIITTRKTESTVTIKSGYTLAIGGLIEKTSGNRESKVPLLGDIPLLGRAFRSETKSTDQRNLIVFITAKILSASGATYRDVFSQRTLHEMGIKGRDLPGYEPPESERELFDALQQSRDQLERIQTEMRLRQQLQQLQQTQQKESDRGQKPTQSGTIRRRFQ